MNRQDWSLPPIGRLERDPYAREDMVYVSVCDENDDVIACARLLPTTGSHPLPDIFSELLAGAKAPKHPGVWELSRFATGVRADDKGRMCALSQLTLELLESVFAHGRRANIDRLLLVTTISIERLMLRAGLEAHRFGPTISIDGSYCVALFIEVPRTPVDGAKFMGRRRAVSLSGNAEIARIIRPVDDSAGRLSAAFALAIGA